MKMQNEIAAEVRPDGMVVILFTDSRGHTSGIVVLDRDGNIHRHADALRLSTEPDDYHHAYLLTPSGFAQEPFWTRSPETLLGDEIREAFGCLDPNTVALA